MGGRDGACDDPGTESMRRRSFTPDPRGVAGLGPQCCPFGIVSYRWGVFFPISDLNKNKIGKFISVLWTPQVSRES